MAQQKSARLKNKEKETLSQEQRQRWFGFIFSVLLDFVSSNVLSSANVEFKKRPCAHMCSLRAAESLTFPPRQTALNFVFPAQAYFTSRKCFTQRPSPPRPRVASDDHTRINTSARLTAGAARLRDVFSRSQIVPLHFITAWSLLCRRLLTGCNWEQMRRPVHASVVMSARAEGKARRGWGRKWSWSDGGGVNGVLGPL